MTDGDKNLPTQSSQLHNSGGRAGHLIDESFKSLNPTQRQEIMAKAAEEALRLEAKSREQQLDYVAGKKSVEDHIDTFNMLDKQGKLTRHSVTTDVKTGAGNMRIESKSGATCFVATAIYGDPEHPDVVFLRAFRDIVLSQNQLGRKFIAWYWRLGPGLAQRVSESKILKAIFRKMVFLIVKGLKSHYARKIR